MTGWRLAPSLAGKDRRVESERKEHAMPFVDIKVIEGAFSPDEQRELVERVSEAVIAVEGESLRAVTHVAITETPSGMWAIGGQTLTGEDVRAKRGVTAAA
jgi:4-oxalocrotonate tautomerase